MKNCYFIIHESFSSPFDNWFPYLRSEIEKRNGVLENIITVSDYVNE